MEYLLFLLPPCLPIILVALHPVPLLKAKLAWAAAIATWLLATVLAAGAIAHNRPDGLTPPELENWTITTGFFVYIVACIGAWLAFLLFRRAYRASSNGDGPASAGRP